MNFKQANGANFARGRTQPIEFLVIHYTANNGDTVQNNLDYFSRNTVGASAHYFVDENGYGQSVKDQDTAWHSGMRPAATPTALAWSCARGRTAAAITTSWTRRCTTRQHWRGS